MNNIGQNIRLGLATIGIYLGVTLIPMIPAMINRIALEMGWIV